MTSTSSLAFAWRHSLAALLVLSASVVQSAAADDDRIEREQLAALVRQIDLLDRLAEHGARISPQERTRYHFDYARLRDDLQRVRAGIDDYLTPQRAQPRDPTVLVGEYRRESAASGKP